MAKKDAITSSKTAHLLVTSKKYASTSTPVFQVGAESIATSFPGFYAPAFLLMGFVKDRGFVPPLSTNVAENRTRITAAVAVVRQRCYEACGKILTTGGTSAALQTEVT
jgi:hypothetical protein